MKKATTTHSVQNKVFELCLSHSIYNTLQCTLRGRRSEDNHCKAAIRTLNSNQIEQWHSAKNDFFSSSNRLYEIATTLLILHITEHPHTHIYIYINYKCQIHLLVVKIHFNTPQLNENTKPG